MLFSYTGIPHLPRKTMYQHLLFTLCAALAIVPTCRADGAYVGVGGGRSSKITVHPPGAGPASDRGSPSWHLYGGATLSGNWSLEGGLLHAAFDLGPAPALYANTVYGAGKYTWALGDTLSLHGKAGVAYNHYTYNGTTGRDHASSVTPMLAVGAEWKITPQWSVAVEAANYGKTTAKGMRLTRGQAEAGLKFSF